MKQLDLLDARCVCTWFPRPTIGLPWTGNQHKRSTFVGKLLSSFMPTNHSSVTSPNRKETNKAFTCSRRSEFGERFEYTQLNT